MERNEEKFESYFQFLSARKNWDGPKSNTQQDQQPGYPSMYCVYILNNGNKENDFLISILKQFFHKNNSQAQRASAQINKEGRTLCNTYTKDAAETKVMQVLEYAQSMQQEVKCIMQKSDYNAIKKS